MIIKGRIYKIVDSENNECYIGKTMKNLPMRFSKHKTDYKRWKLGMSSYYTVFGIFEKFGVDNCKIELVEECVLEDMSHREVYHIEQFSCVNRLNKRRKILKKVSQGTAEESSCS